MILHSTSTSSCNSRQAILACHEAGWEVESHHLLAWSRLPAWTTPLPERFKTALGKRLFPELEGVRLVTHAGIECLARALALLKAPRLAVRMRNALLDQATARRLRRSSSRVKVVHGYFDTSLRTFRAARELGIQTIYELPAPYWRAVVQWLEPERSRHPDWAATLPSLEAEHTRGPQRDVELQLADAVLVPSALVRDSLQLAPPFKATVHVVPYGCPEVNGHSSHTTPPSPHPLRLLFVGTLSQSKGLADLLEAIQPLGSQVELSLAGAPIGPLPPALDPPPTNVRLLGQVAHASLLQQMALHDVLVLPTLYEGLSLALLEAMAAGMVIVTTTRSGLGSLVISGQEAILLEPGEPAALTQCLESLMENPGMIASLRAAAQTWAAKHSWTSYRRSLREAIEVWL